SVMVNSLILLVISLLFLQQAFSSDSLACDKDPNRVCAADADCGQGSGCFADGLGAPLNAGQKGCCKQQADSAPTTSPGEDNCRRCQGGGWDCFPTFICHLGCCI
ncbi:hypothetical protein PENTCL1PPCAC_13514, partial [Pristionchus entomophagus]